MWIIEAVCFGNEYWLRRVALKLARNVSLKHGIYIATYNILHGMAKFKNFIDILQVKER